MSLIYHKVTQYQTASFLKKTTQQLVNEDVERMGDFCQLRYLAEARFICVAVNHSYSLRGLHYNYSFESKQTAAPKQPDFRQLLQHYFFSTLSTQENG